jgi:arylsulfatase A-like enzyme
MALPPTLLSQLTNRYGAYPATSTARNDWTAKVLSESLWADGVPPFTFLWLVEPDATQHETGPGSARSLSAIRNADDNLARILKALDAKGLRDSTDIIVVSDHGCSTVAANADVSAELLNAGLKATRAFKSKPVPGDVLVVSNSGSSFVYVIGHGEAIIRKVVEVLQSWDHAGAIFTRISMPGTFGLERLQLDSEAPPDVVVSLRWTSVKNTNGVPGTITTDGASFKPGQGAHVSLSPWDMHATLVAAGPDFRSGIVSTLPSGNVDVAPTVLWLLGIKPPTAMDGRVLTEALTLTGPPLTSFNPRRVECSVTNAGRVRHQYLNYVEVNGVEYIQEANGGYE